MEFLITKIKFHILLSNRQQDEKNISFRFVPIIALGFASAQLAWSLFDMAVPVILNEHYGKSLSVIGFIMSLDNIIAFFMLPIIGLYSDRVRTRIGRRMPFIIPGVIIGAIIFIFIPLAKSFSIIVFLTVIILFSIVMAVYRSPTVSLIPDFLSSERRSMGNAISNLVAGIAAGISLLGAGSLLEAGYTVGAFAFISISMIVCLVILASVIREPQKFTIKEEFEIGIFTQLKNEINKMFTSVDKSMLFMLLAILSWFVALNAIIAFYSTYVWKIFLPHLDSEKAAGEASKVLFMFPVIFVIFSLVGGYYGGRLGRIKTMKIGLIILLISLAVSSFIRENSLFGYSLDWKTSFSIIFITAAIGWGLVNVNSIVVIWEHSEDNGIGTGLYYTFSNAAAIFGPIIAGITMDLIHINALFPFTIFFILLSIVFLLQVKTGEAGEHNELIQISSRIE